MTSSQSTVRLCMLFAFQALNTARLRMCGMSLGQTIGRLCQPAQDVLGGLYALERHLNFPFDMYTPPVITAYHQARPQGEWMAVFVRGNSHFLSLLGPVRCQDKVFYWRSMCKWANAVLGKCSHPELNPKSF